MKIPFGGRVLILGCGSVSQCLQPLVLRHFEMDFSKLTIMDFEDLRHAIPDTLAAGAKYVQDRVTRDNLPTLLSQYLGSGDLLIDLAWNIDCGEIIQWCHDRLAHFKTPRTVVFGPLPKTSTGKIQKYVLRQRAKEL